CFNFFIPLGTKYAMVAAKTAPMIVGILDVPTIVTSDDSPALIPQASSIFGWYKNVNIKPEICWNTTKRRRKLPKNKINRFTLSPPHFFRSEYTKIRYLSNLFS